MFGLDPVIISGGPGAGKTTLVSALELLGYSVGHEIPRRLITEQKTKSDGILPWFDLAGFAQLCFGEMVLQRKSLLASSLAFVDRGIPDICGYLENAGLIVDDLILIESRRGYHNTVFLCKPVEQYYIQDDFRPYPFSEALELHDSLIKTYTDLGYNLIEIPWGITSERVDFVLKSLNNLSKKETV
ncbi:AAA family ATPase [Vibrio sp. ZSDZ34]|jgi:predicted ATPase|uniref:AAA family ATPase n=1 Tax=Vibrio gelatinilyticus TaxID=2893468 RepID=A0A9X2AXD3_9VIBR|nr:AAA family ATPase [Vibrio gelatinilyticus]MCJ2378894.1 AAA family ATPase [Vibrio gelatinilyticus]